MHTRWLGPLAALGALLACPASGTAAQGATRLVVTPAHPHPGSTVVIGFLQPTVAAEPTTTQSAETLRVIGPSRPGCESDAVRSIAGVAAGSRLRATLRPSRADGGRWCVGEYRASLVFTRSSGCPIGTPRRVCPQFVIAPTVLATARFHITAR